MLAGINTASLEEFQLIPGIGKKKAEYRIQYRDHYGVITKEALNLVLMGELTSDVLNRIDFTPPITAGTVAQSLPESFTEKPQPSTPLSNIEGEIQQTQAAINKLLSFTHPQLLSTPVDSAKEQQPDIFRSPTHFPSDRVRGEFSMPEMR